MSIGERETGIDGEELRTPDTFILEGSKPGKMGEAVEYSPSETVHWKEIIV